MVQVTTGLNDKGPQAASEIAGRLGLALFINTTAFTHCLPKLLPCCYDRAFVFSYLIRILHLSLSSLTLINIYGRTTMPM